VEESVQLRVTASAQFSASHQVPGHPTCGRKHGHRWTLEVTAIGGPDPTSGYVVGGPPLAAAVRDFCAEIDDEDLAAMFPGSPPTAEGVALAARERLILSHRGIEDVTVSMDDDYRISVR
jgi:6-pyruvoyl-tetrahydropterin synthase